MKKLCSKCNKLHEHDHNCTVGKFDKYYRDDEAYALRNSRKWWATRDEAKERDNYLCLACRYLDHYLNSRTLEVHHIKGVRDYPELVYVVSNCITLCRYHHSQVHKHGFDLEPLLAKLPWYSVTLEYPPTL